MTEETLIGISMGCPVGIGPEIILKFLSAFDAEGGPRPIVIGDLGVMARMAERLGLGGEVRAWRPGDPCPAGPVWVWQPYGDELSLPPQELAWGRPTRATGLAMAACVEAAARLTLSGGLAAMVTCPITKAALRAAGYAYPGHTEMLAAWCGSNDYAMMMAGASLKVTLVTIHQALATVPGSLSEEAIARLIAITWRSLREDFGVVRPRLAVAGLNPHAGEGGLFGDEEERLLAPAISQARSKGWLVEGPLAPDTVFAKAAGGQFDAVVCMYHDQGLIPFKLLHFEDGVNVTLGLPIVRTSVDHGTAYDIAGQGRANPASLRAAFLLAAEIALRRRRLHSRGEG